MDAVKQRQREVLELVQVITAGDATPAERDRLSQLVAQDPDCRRTAVWALQQEAQLSRRLVEDPSDDTLADLLPKGAATPKHAGALRQAGASRALTKETLLAPTRRSTAWLSLAAALLVMLGAVGGGLTTWWIAQPQLTALAQSEDNHTAASATAHGRQLYLAKFVQGTGCVWEPGSLPPDVGESTLRGGETFNLIEGLADIALSLPAKGTAALTMEGPARMILRAEGIPSLLQGKFTARVHPHSAAAKMETTFGQVVASESSSYGVTVRGLEGELHVFSGGITLVSPWLARSSQGDSLYVKAGESVRVSVGNEDPKFEMGAADPEYFATRYSMGEDRLAVTDTYVNAIKAASPLIYWRFDQARQGRVRNLVGDRYHGLIRGGADLPLQGENQVIEFGAGLPQEALHGFVELSEPLSDELVEGYSVELWMKPSHFHLGSLVSAYLPGSQGARHGVLVELGGTPSAPTAIEHAGQVRFLHRDPPEDDTTKGNSCFTQDYYKLRQWTHVVAAKDRQEMRLFINGRLAATTADKSKLNPGLTIAIAQLDTRRHSRAFIGQMDEIAIYDRALPASEVQQHYTLLRPPAAAPPAPTGPSI